MTIDFFSARKLQHAYFQKLTEELNCQKIQTAVLWHKSLVVKSFWLPSLFDQPKDTRKIVKEAFREKQNARKHQNRSSLYWSLFTLAKIVETHILFAIYHSVFKTRRTHTLILWNGLKYRQSIAALAAKTLGIQCLYMENGLIPETTTIDSKGINYHNSLPRKAEFYLQKDYTTYPLMPVESAESDYFFVPFQVTTDTQITRFSPWIKDMNALVDLFIQATKTLGRKMPKIIFKAHPAGDENLKLIKEKIAHYEQLNLAESEDTQTLINHAKAVITINSTVGIESLLKAKPVLILGQAFYNINGLTLSASNNSQFINALSELNDFKPNDKLLNNFLYHLHYKYQIKGNWRQADTEHIKAMSQRIIELSHAA